MIGYDSKPTFKRPYTPSETLLPLEAVLALPVTDIPSRGIDKATAEYYDIRQETDASGDPIAFYFIYRQNGIPIGYQKRYKTHDGKRAFITYGDVSVKNDLFGAHKVSSARRLYVTEGPFDAPSLFKVFTRRAQERGYDGPPPAVVSIGLGTANAAQQMLENSEYLKGFKEIVLVFDSDSASPEEARRGIKRGREAVAEVVTSLPDFDIKQVLLPLKDANEMLMEGRGKELAELAVFQAKEWLPESLQGYNKDIEKEIDYLETPMKRGTYIDFLPRTSGILRGIRPNEMTIVIAPSGIGKSTLSKQVAFSLLKAEPDARVANFYLEEGILKAKQSFLALYHNVRLAELRENPGLITREQKREFLEWQKDRLTFYDCDRAGILSPDSVERMIRYCAVMGYTHIIFDHLHFVLTGAEDSSVHKIDNLLTKLSLIPRGYPVHLWVVAHITKKGQYPIPKDPQSKEPIYPHFMPVNADDARGCVDGKTEFLCPDGWVRMDQYSGQKVTQFDLRTRKLSFVTPERYIAEPCEHLTEITSKYLSMALSDDHRVVFKHDYLDEFRMLPWRYVYAKYRRQSQGFEGLIPRIVGEVDERPRLQWAPIKKVGRNPVTITKFVPGDKKQYCFEVPSGVLLLRRDNKVFITGNSSSFRQLTWNLLCLEPEIVNEAGEKGRVRVVVRKNREWGDECVGDILQYNKTTGLLQ